MLVQRIFDFFRIVEENDVFAVFGQLGASHCGGGSSAVSGPLISDAPHHLAVWQFCPPRCLPLKDRRRALDDPLPYVHIVDFGQVLVEREYWIQRHLGRRNRRVEPSEVGKAIEEVGCVEHGIDHPLLHGCDKRRRAHFLDRRAPL